MKSVEKFTIFGNVDFNFQFFKKLTAVFVAFLLSFNVLIPKGHELKNVFFGAFNCAFNAVELNFIDECTERIFGTTDIIVANVLKIMKSSRIAQPQIQSNKSDNENNKVPVPTDNTSNTNAILTQQNLTAGTLINFIKTKKLSSYSVSMFVKSIYAYNTTNVCKNKTATDIWMLLFILFSIFTVKIKDVLNNNILRTYKIEPAWL